MKKFIYVLALSLVVFSCSKDDDNSSQQKEGTIAEIKNWANPEVINAIEILGFTIHEGTTPPNIEGTYSLKNRLLQNTNVPNDWPLGTAFFELRFTLSNQDNSQQIINFDATEYDSNGVSTEEEITVIDYVANSFITGSDDNFTVFFKVDETKQGYTATLLYAITGKKTVDGFETFQQGLVMLDDSATPSTIFIRNNQGRIFIDQDGLVEEL
jgi:hypothetical protein